MTTARGDGQTKIPESFSFTGRIFLHAELNLIKQICSDFQALGRTEISRTVCELLEWRRLNGSLKNHECRLLLERLEELGWLNLPPVRSLGRRGPRAVQVTSRSELEPELHGSVGSMVPLRLEVIEPGAEGQSRLWRELIERYHYLHCRVPVGANLRYLVRSEQCPERVLACLLWSSPAWKMAARDRWAGWNDQQRRRNLQLIVNNSRFLILPWIRIRGLASTILSLCARRLPEDWEQHYGYRPVLLETLVNAERFRGTCYRAANWIWLGRSQGRGRMDHHHALQDRAPKDIYIYPLRRDARRCLCEAVAPGLQRFGPGAGMTKHSICEDCLEKQQKIDQLVEENSRLKAQLRYRDNRQKDGFFGSSTPSAQRPVKPNTEPEKQSKRGGLPQGHPGHGRKGFHPDDAARIVDVGLDAACPDCGRPMEDKGIRYRSVLEIPPPRPEPILYRLRKNYCPHCQKAHQAQAPAVLPKALLGNQLIARIAFMHYVHGIPLGRICDQMGLDLGTVVQMLPRLAGLFKPVLPRLIELYRSAPVRHADETSWRTDGHSGYAWLFCTPHLSIFMFRLTRSASVPREVFGNQPLPGVLVVDRYNGYNRVPCKLQYCYAHLMREVEDLAKEFPDHAEVSVFTATFIPLLASVMHLRSQPITDQDYYRQAAALQHTIVSLSEQPAQHLGIRRIQDIFRDHADRLYHWVNNRNVPADNNRSERELRPTVIARKVSFGSQSEAGAKTREIMMSVLHTLKKRQQHAEDDFKSVLDHLAGDIQKDAFSLLFPADSS